MKAAILERINEIFDEISRALEKVASGRSKGKTVIKMQSATVD